MVTVLLYDIVSAHLWFMGLSFGNFVHTLFLSIVYSVTQWPEKWPPVPQGANFLNFEYPVNSRRRVITVSSNGWRSVRLWMQLILVRTTEFRLKSARSSSLNFCHVQMTLWNHSRVRSSFRKLSRFLFIAYNFYPVEMKLGRLLSRH